MKKRLDANRKTRSRTRQFRGVILSLCLASILVFAVGVGVFDRHLGTSFAYQPATEDEASSEQLAENAPSAEQSDPFEIVSDPELGDYEKGKVLIFVDDSQSPDQINAVLEDSEFAQTKSVSEQDTSVGFVQVEISDTTEIEQALASFERAGLEVQPNYVYYPAEETVHEEEIQERRACSDGNELRNEDLQKREDAIRETTIGEEAAAVAEEQTNVHAELSSPNEAIVSLVGTEAITKINDPQASSQWALDSLDMYKAWNIKKCEGAVSVAVIDTGCLTSHEDLRANIKDTYNSVDKTSTVTDDDPGGHGTHVAGIVSADADNGIGVAGTSYDAGLIIIKSSKLDNGSSAFSSAWLAQAYAWLMGDDDNDGSTVAQTHNVRVVNMSLGGKGAVGGDIAANDKALLDKITEAKSKQILTVCAAGNSMANATPPYDCFPGDYSDCFSVINLLKNSAGTPNDSAGRYSVAKASNSNFNTAGSTAKDISAPGTDILSTSKTGSYVSKNSTSMASPAVAGVAAMLFAYEPSLTPQNAQTLLEQTATDLGDTGWDSETGYGEVDAYHALQVLSARIDMESVPFAGSATLAIACDDGSSLPAFEWSWTSSNPNVLAVDENTGTLTAKGRGSATITATHKKVTTEVISKEVQVGAADLSQAVIGSIADQSYMGNEITPSISVTVNGVKLSQGTDYQLAYQNNVNAGEATVVVKPASGIGSEKRATFRIAPASLDRVSIGAIESQKYTGQAITPVPEVMFNGKPLVKDVDFTLAYVNNIDNGQAQVTVKGIGNFSGERTVTFNIGKSVSNATISDVSSSCTYTGSAVCPVPRVTHGDNELTKGKDFEVTYKNNINAGTNTATMIITGIGEYSGQVERKFSIAKKSLNSGGVVIKSIPAQTYSGSECTPDVVVTYGDQTLRKGTDYYLSYSYHTDAGTANVTIVGKNANYTGSLSTTFEIKPVSLASATVSGITDKTYNGAAQTQNVTVKLGGKTLSASDYAVTYKDNVKAGIATVVITGRKNYTGTKSATFKINAAPAGKSIASATVTTSQMIRNANGNVIVPSITVKYGSITLKNGTDYSVEYYLNGKGSPVSPKAAGSYTIKVKGKGNYSGEAIAKDTFKLVQGPSVSSSTQVKIAPIANLNYVLDAVANPPKIGANVSIWNDNGGNNQKWYLELGNDGYYTIKSAANKSFIIDAAANPPKVGSNVSIWTTKNQNNQKWVIEPSTNGSYIIRNAANPSLVLDAAGVSPKCGANVSVWSAKSQNNNNQKWKIVTVNAPSFDANKTYEISSVSNSSFVLDAAANPPKIGANVSIWKKKNQANQKWYIQKDSQGYYTIRSAANKSFILDAAANPPRAGSNVSIWTSKNQANQKWIIEQLANGSYIIKSVGNSKLVLDATGATPKIGANVSVWTANGGNNQKWNIKPA